jgi:hypothetical protein
MDYLERNRDQGVTVGWARQWLGLPVFEVIVIDLKSQFSYNRYMLKNVTLRKLHEDSGDRKYWLAQSPEKRLEAMAVLRGQYFEIRQEPEPRLQRILSLIVGRKS